ncbi:MAG: KH domain-containing protein [Patescibacteria group bacterium]|nr:KH domain-containing protein [Patescibacteria group bacterium]
MKNADSLVALMTDVVKGFIIHPEDLKVTQISPTSRSLLICLQPHAHDMGKVIGEGGAMVKALRELASQMGEAVGLRVKVEVQEPVVGRRRHHDPFKHDPNYCAADDLLRLERIARFIFDECAQVRLLGDGPEHSTLVLMVDLTKFDCERELVDALDVVWRATGLAHGHKLSVEMEAL